MREKRGAGTSFFITSSQGGSGVPDQARPGGDKGGNAPSQAGQALVLEESRRGHGHSAKRSLRDRRWYGIGPDASWGRGEGRAPGQTRPGGEGRRMKRALGRVGAGHRAKCVLKERGFVSSASWGEWG